MLREWMTEQGRDVAATARMLGVSQSTLYRWLDGSRRPSLDVATYVQVVTNIPATAWATPVEKK